jgi:hypothetical protein
MKVKIPNSKSQIPNKHQIPNSNGNKRLARAAGPAEWPLYLEFGAWNLFGIWDLGFGI